MRHVLRDWPALMKPATARAYLDDLPRPAFTALVVPHLDARRIGNSLRFTRASIDTWIEGSGPKGEVQTPAQLGHLLDDAGDA